MAPELEHGTRHLQISHLSGHNSYCTWLTDTTITPVSITGRNKDQTNTEEWIAHLPKFPQSVSQSVIKVSLIQVFFVWSSRKDSYQGQVQSSVHWPAASGAGEGVSVQPLHHNEAKDWAVHGTEPLRETGETTGANEWKAERLEVDEGESTERTKSRWDNTV